MTTRLHVCKSQHCLRGVADKTVQVSKGDYGNIYSYISRGPVDIEYSLEFVDSDDAVGFLLTLIQLEDYSHIQVAGV